MMIPRKRVFCDGKEVTVVTAQRRTVGLGLKGIYIVAGLETASPELISFGNVWISQAQNRDPEI
jgi:hypothetical protein